MILAELVRRGRGERILVVTPKHILEQMQHELWCRFALPFVRLDSTGIQKVRQKLPATRNPFTYFKRAIISIDTLKSPRYKAHLERHQWDAVVIDESHNLTNSGTQNNELARNTEALILASATPHNGKEESFAELLRLLDPTVVHADGTFTKPDVESLLIRRHRHSPDVAAEVGSDWAERAEPVHLPGKLASEYRNNGSVRAKDLTVDGVTFVEPFVGVDRERDRELAQALLRRGRCDTQRLGGLVPDIETHSYTVTKALQNCFYRVPDYQREYVWGPDEAIQLLDDINESIGDDRKQYFVGTVLVAPEGAGAQPDELDLIDGQQRTTTFFLILCALRRRFLHRPQQPTIEGLLATSYTNIDGNTVSRLRLRPCYDNAAELVDFLRQYDGDDAALADDLAANGLGRFGSAQRIAEVFVAISGYLNRNFPDEAEIAKFWGHFANRVIFIQIQTDVSSALKIFETINERGIGLNPMDLLKNLLFTQVKPDDFSKLKDRWKSVTSPLEKHKQKPLRFLRYYIMANYDVRDSKGGNIVREDDIYTWFADKRNAELTGYTTNPFRFVDGVANNVENYIAFYRNHDAQGEPSVALTNLRYLTGTAFSQHYVLLLAAARFSPAAFTRLIVELENFLFFYLFTSSNTRELEALFSNWAAELRAIAEVPSATAQMDALNDFVTSRFQTSMDSRRDALRDALRRFRLGSMQQYRSRYLLARIAQYVDMEYAGSKVRGSLEPYMKLDIEHILPQRPRDELLAAWDQDGAHDYADYVHRLGNLTLLEKPHNIVAGNDFFDAKMVLYAVSSIYMTRSIARLSEVGKNTSVTAINRYLDQFADWDAAAIDLRTESLIILAVDIWRTRSDA